MFISFRRRTKETIFIAGCKASCNSKIGAFINGSHLGWLDFPVVPREHIADASSRSPRVRDTHTYRSSWTMHNESIHRYWIPSIWVTVTASWKVFGKSLQEIPSQRDRTFSIVEMQDLWLPQTWLKEIYLGFLTPSISRIFWSTQSPKSIKRLGGWSITLVHAMCVLSHVSTHSRILLERVASLGSLASSSTSPSSTISQGRASTSQLSSLLRPRLPVPKPRNNFMRRTKLAKSRGSRKYLFSL